MTLNARKLFDRYLYYPHPTSSSTTTDLPKKLYFLLFLFFFIFFFFAFFHVLIMMLVPLLSAIFLCHFLFIYLLFLGGFSFLMD